MTNGERRPETSNFYDEESARLLESITPQWQIEHGNDFEELDIQILEVEQHIANRESEVTTYLQDTIKDIGALQKMLGSISEHGEKEYPTCDHVFAALEKIALENSETDKSPTMTRTIGHMQQLIRITQEFAGTSPVPMFETKSDLVMGISKMNSFSIIEQKALAHAANVFLSSET